MLAIGRPQRWGSPGPIPNPAVKPTRVDVAYCVAQVHGKASTLSTFTSLLVGHPIHFIGSSNESGELFISQTIKYMKATSPAVLTRDTASNGVPSS